MRGLSLWQPCASFVALGYKKNETRSWYTPFRGVIAIHAAKNKTAIPDADDILEDAGLLPEDRTTVGGTTWPLGEYVAVARLMDCVRTETIRDGLTKCERAMGNYSDGRFAWIFSDVRKLSPRVEGRGRQSLYFIDGHALREIEKQVPDLVRAESGLFA